jgi:hypothetical protein
MNRRSLPGGSQTSACDTWSDLINENTFDPISITMYSNSAIKSGEAVGNASLA